MTHFPDLQVNFPRQMLSGQNPTDGKSWPQNNNRKVGGRGRQLLEKQCGKLRKATTYSQIKMQFKPDPEVELAIQTAKENTRNFLC